jgi:hypothetical protein
MGVNVNLARGLEVMRMDTPDWGDRVRDHVEQGLNFFLIINGEEHVKDFCGMFDLPVDCLAKPLTRSDFLLLSRYVQPDTFDQVLGAWENNEQVIFVDQLDFPINKPPRLRHFIVYSSVLGIISQHDGPWEARAALSSYQNTPTLHRPAPEADVYQWNIATEKWELAT